MAKSAMFSSSVLSSAASGYRMPSLQVTLAFVNACGGDEEDWRQRWFAATGGSAPLAARGGYGSLGVLRRQAGGLPYPAQLPQRPRGFVGRAAELKWLRTPGDTPIVISGPVGAGKTDLALHYAYTRAAQMADGQLYADLGVNRADGEPSAPGAHDILDGFLRALGVPADQLSGSLDHLAGLYRTLVSERRLLVLLDNVTDERQVRPLLVETGTSTTLLVSRKRLLGLRDVRRLHVASMPRRDSIAMIIAAFPEGVAAGPDDFDRLAEFCGDLPLALDIALRKISARPYLTLREIIDGWQRNGNALDWLCIGDLSMRESLLSAYLTLSEPARMLLHGLARIAANDVSPLPSPDGELAEELVDAGIITRAHHDVTELHLPPPVREFALDMADSVVHGLAVAASSVSAA